MNRRMKRLLHLTVVIAAVVFVFTVGWKVNEVWSAESQTQSIRLRLPRDFDKALSITNSRKGVVLGYHTKDGRLRSVQYSGMGYKQMFFFDFVKPRS